jgi:hypothetical protein
VIDPFDLDALADGQFIDFCCLSSLDYTLKFLPSSTIII